MRSKVLGPLVLAVLLAAGCTSEIEAECHKAKECGEIDKTEDQCTADWEKSKADTEADESCQIVVDKTLALFECKSDLDCEARKDLSKGVCAEANSDAIGAYATHLGCLFK